MKRIILFLIVATFATQLFAYEKLSLVERFTNASCGPCATLNNAWYTNTTQNLVASGSMAHIVYNTWWPGSGDPMYILNQPDNTVRTNYYQPTSPKYVPWIEINGVTFPTSSSSTAFINTVTNGNNQFAPFKIIISQVALGESLIEVSVKIIRDPTDVTTFSSPKLRVALTEKTVAYSSPPGSNGESVFYSICRKMLPNAEGTAFTVPVPGDSVEFSLQYIPTSTFLQSVNMDSIRVVAFVQDDPSQLIYQSAILELVPNFVATIAAVSPDAIISNENSAEFTTSLYNVGVLDDSYDINVNLVGPAGWTGEFTTVNGTFQFGQIDSVQVAVGDSTLINVMVQPNGFNGSGEVSIEYSSKNDPGVTGSTVLRTVTNTGVHLLVVEATEDGYSSLVTESLDEFYEGRYGVVSRTAIQASNLDLSNFTMISWSAGNSTPAFYQEEVDNLQDYLDQGGNLLMNGQNIGSDIFESSGQSQFAQSFFNNYLHANYITDLGPSYFMTGYAGDPITDGITIAGINAVYPGSPDQIEPYDANTYPIVKYGSGPAINSVRADDENFKVVYFGIGFEQIFDAATVDSLITRSIRWLTEGIVLDNDDAVSLPIVYNLDQNYPNPFNPATTISYTIPSEAQVSLVVYDIMGKEIASLVNGKQAAGKHTIKFDASLLASGTYFYKLSADDFISVKKMVLLK